MAYRPHEFAKLIGKSTSTLRRWDKEDKLVPKRGIGGQRYYTEQDLQKALNLENNVQRGKTIVYCRVSSVGQKDDLASQVTAMEGFCLGAGIATDEWLQEIGGGLNLKRRVFLNLMKSIRLGEISNVIIAHSGRLARERF